MSKYNPNCNHPKKGSTIKVEPIRKLKDIRAIKQVLANKPRDYLLFVMGINNGLRAGDLLKLRVLDVGGLKSGQSTIIKEGKTGKENVLMVNKCIDKALQKYIKAYQPGAWDYLFASQKTKKPLTIQAVNALVKKWTRTINLKGNYGAHTLRKTFGYIQRTKDSVGIEILTKRFNHSSPSVTMRYLGITADEVNDILMNEI